MRVTLAIPTIAARPGLAEQTGDRWRQLTPEADLEVVTSTAGESWGDGLNDAWARTRDNPPDVWVCGSDDMIPADNRWLPAILPWLTQGCYPVPHVSDPRFENHGGPDHPASPVSEGQHTYMSTFPILRGDWLDRVFPVPDGLHYYTDNLIGVKLWLAGVQAVCVPACRIMHLHAREGRGAGYGSENTRLLVDTVRYTRALSGLGVDRATLPAGLRGGMWEERFLTVGEQLRA